MRCALTSAGGLCGNRQRQCSSTTSPHHTPNDNYADLNYCIGVREQPVDVNARGAWMLAMSQAMTLAHTATGKFNAEAIAIQDRCSFDLARQRRSERDFREEKEAIIWQFFCQHRCIAAPTNRCIFAPMFMALDFSVRFSLLPRSRRLDKLCAAATWCHPPHVTATHEKKARKKSRAFVTSVEGGLNSPYPHTSARRHRRSTALLLRRFSDHGFRGDQQPGD